MRDGAAMGGAVRLKSPVTLQPGNPCVAPGEETRFKLPLLEILPLSATAGRPGSEGEAALHSSAVTPLLRRNVRDGAGNR